MPDEIELCPRCLSPACKLGALGTLTHFRCRHCGTEFATETNEDHRV